jgi:hypothetical protein
MIEDGQRHESLPLSKQAMEYLVRSGKPDNSDTLERVADQFAAAGLPTYPMVLETFYRFGGSILPMGLDGRFKVYRAKQAIRMIRLDGDGSDDPDQFRIPIGQSEFIQAYFRMDGLGRLYEDDRRIADSIVAWIEHWARQQ